VSSDPKKVVNLDRLRQNGAEPVPGASGSPQAGHTPAEDLDIMVSHFLDHVNSFTEDFTSRQEATPEELDSLLSELDDSTEISRRVSIAASPTQPEMGVDSIAPQYVPVRPGRPNSRPISFSRGLTPLDEKILRTLEELEALPKVPDTVQPPRTAAGSAGIAAPQPAARETVPPAAEIAEEIAVPKSLTEQLIAREEVPVPAGLAPAPVETARHPLPEFDYAFLRPFLEAQAEVQRGRRRRLLWLAAVVCVFVLAAVAYLATRPQPLPTSGAGIDQPAQNERAAEPAPPGAVTPAVDQTAPPTPQTEPPKEQPRAQAPARKPAEPFRRTPELSTPNRFGSVRTAAGSGTWTATPPAAPAAQQQPAGHNYQTVLPSTASENAAPAETSPAKPQTDEQPGETTAPAPQAPQPLGTAGPAASGPEIPPATVPLKPAEQPPSAQPAPGLAETSTPAEVISKVLPPYPQFARSRNLSGRIELRVQIDAEGRVSNAKALSGPDVFYVSAVEAVRKWRFKPATLGGKNVASQGTVTVVFNNQR
jgi:periplasmic protein TonB